MNYNCLWTLSKTLCHLLIIQQLLNDRKHQYFVYNPAWRKKGVVLKLCVKYEHSIEQYISHHVQLLIKNHYDIYLVITFTMTTTSDDSTKQKYHFIKKNHTQVPNPSTWQFIKVTQGIVDEMLSLDKNYTFSIWLLILIQNNLETIKVGTKAQFR